MTGIWGSWRFLIDLLWVEKFLKDFSWGSSMVCRDVEWIPFLLCMVYERVTSGVMKLRVGPPSEACLY